MEVLMKAVMNLSQVAQIHTTVLLSAPAAMLLKTKMVAMF
jgi:hypothetical protein